MSERARRVTQHVCECDARRMTDLRQGDDRHLHELAGDMLAVVREQGWIRADFIDELFNRHLQDHPAFYGEFVWVLMALGIWHRQHAA